MEDYTSAAVTTVLKIMLDPNSPAPTRLRAAEVVLEKASKAGAMEDREGRVAKLERTTRSGRKSRKRCADLTLLSTAPLLGPAPEPPQVAEPRLNGAEPSEDEVE